VIGHPAPVEIDKRVKSISESVARCAKQNIQDRPEDKEEGGHRSNKLTPVLHSFSRHSD
jgi:hypothetical protein